MIHPKSGRRPLCLAEVRERRMVLQSEQLSMLNIAASKVNGVICRELVRRLCDNCYDPSIRHAAERRYEMISDTISLVCSGIR